MKNYDPDHPLIFIHVPKTGGQSVRDVFRKWFKDGLLGHYFNEHSGQNPDLFDLDFLKNNPTPVCIYGHFNRDRGFGVEHSYPKARQFLTILRDPFDMVISSYYFVRKTGARWKDRSRIPVESLDAYLSTVRPNMLNYFPRPVTKENYKDIIEEFFIDIGCTEELPLSLSRIACRLGLPFDEADLPYRNQTPRDDQDARVQNLRADFKERNPLEYMVYEYARSRLHAPGNQTQGL